jgi:hypothetical protein
MFDNFGDFGLLINALGGGGNKGNAFPKDDAIDLRNGATYIPYEVTDARREGKEVVFMQIGEKKDWYWQMPDGTKIK